VASFRWHSTQRVTFNADDSAIMEFQVDGVDEILGWILSYGENVRIVAPKVLQDKVVNAAHGITAPYQRAEHRHALEFMPTAGLT